MLTLPPLTGRIYSPERRWDFATVCPVCLKVWAVVGSGGKGFNLCRVPCLECAYGSTIWYIWGGPTASRIEASIIDRLEIHLDERLTRQPPTVRDIIDTLSDKVIQHEFQAHMKHFDHMLHQEESQ